MQFYDLFKDLMSLIPESLSGVRGLFSEVLPFVLLACSLFTAFFGLKCAGLWCSLTFFFTGVVVSAQLLLTDPDIYELWYWIALSVCLSVGVICAFFSKYLARVQLVASEFALVFASVPTVLLFLGGVPAKVVSFIIALAIAFLTVKYKYIIIIVTTSFSGSFIFWEVIEQHFAFRYKLLCAILTGVAALAFQVWMNWEQLKNTYEDVKKKAEKTKHGGEKAIAYVKEHHEHHEHTHPSEASDEAAQTVSDTITDGVPDSTPEKE